MDLTLSTCDLSTLAYKGMRLEDLDRHRDRCISSESHYAVIPQSRQIQLHFLHWSPEKEYPSLPLLLELPANFYYLSRGRGGTFQFYVCNDNSTQMCQK